MTEFAVQSEKIKVAIIEDRREIRDGLAMLIGGTEGFVCTGSYRCRRKLPREGSNCSARYGHQSVQITI